MKKQERRARVCLLLILCLFIGLSYFIYNYAHNYSDWATFYGNTQIYTDGAINRGTIVDRNDNILLECSKEGYHYNEDYSTRVSTAYVVGDMQGNVESVAINTFKDQLIGYDLINGTFDITDNGKKVMLTIDSDVCGVAYDELAGRTGTVGVYDWKTGEIICLVSTPGFDPEDISEDASFFNNFIDGVHTPGSTFKLVTSAAVIDNIKDRNRFTFTCDGENYFSDNHYFRDVYAHGTVDFKDALAKSCNGAFSKLSIRLGPQILQEYVEKTGLTESIDINGIKTAKGSFVFPADNDFALGWAGIGQGEDLVNPCAMMVYMGAIANKGKPVAPTIIKDTSFLKSNESEKLRRYIDRSTAKELKKMMKNNVVNGYGEENFEGIDLYAKSGTAETNDGSDAWFVGFTDRYAFVVWIQNGGFGSEAAAPVAYNVLKYMKNKGIE